MNSLRRSLALAVLLALAPAFLRAQTVVAGAPTTIDYQGKALDASGAPLANTTAANYEMQFRIYDAQESGSIIWSEKQVVTVSKGLFSVRLGEGTANGTEGSVAQNNLPEAFNGKERFLGVTIVITGQTPVEILPRLAFLATPFAFVANKAVSAERLILNPSVSAAASSINLAQVSYATQQFSTTTTLSDQNHTAIVDAGAAAVTVNLPGVTTRREYSITKRDSSTNIVTVTPPAGGTINGSTASLKLKVLGESVIIQNTANNDWWIISDTRDKTPVGTIISSAKSNNGAPPGYVYCDGGIFNRSAVQYSDLFAAIGTAWGTTNASDFRVPDLRGLFLRGVDGNRGFDEDRNSRTASNSGGNAGDAVGSYQGAALGSHNHTFSASGTTSLAGNHNHGVDGIGGGVWGLARQSHSSDHNRTTDGADNGGRGSELDVVSGSGAIPYSGNHAHSFSVSGTTASTGAGETRPENVAVYYFIKY